ncbi:MAG: hypothetical protein HKL80_10490 [Acidimicrobiales bacterium]|nr:hypothetical protein [Acidimicrobiales bacterium]
MANFKLIRRAGVAIALAIGVFLVSTSTVANAAGTGYPGPTTTTPSGAPGFNILQVQQVSPGSPFTYTFTDQGVSFVITIPAATFSSQTDTIDLVVTSCTPSSLGNAGYAGYSAAVCIGFYVEDVTTNTEIAGPYSPAISFDWTASSIQPPNSDLLTQYNSSTGQWDQISGNQSGGVTLSVGSPSQFALLAQVNTAPSTIAGGTTPQTGKPFLGEEVGAGVLLLAGVSTVVLLARSRKRNAS